MNAKRLPLTYHKATMELEIAKIFISLLVLVNPLGAIPHLHQPDAALQPGGAGRAETAGQ